MARRTWVLTLALVAVGCKKQPANPAPVIDHGSGSSAPTDAATSAIHGEASGMIWSIEKAGKTSNLLATLDAGVDTSQLAPALDDRIKSSRTVALQWNLAEVTLAMLQRKTGTLSADLTPDEKATLEAALTTPFVADLEHVKPSFAATVISAYGLPTENPMQAIINQKAQDAGVPTVYLETGAAQQALLDAWLDVRAEKALIADLAAVKRGNEALRAAFARGDEAALAGMIDQRMPWKTAGRTGPDYAAMVKATVDDRHAAWLTILRPLLAGGSVLVVVDALDAVGPGGLIQVLRDDGYSVTREPGAG